jgi:hypothetical protein
LERQKHVESSHIRWCGYKQVTTRFFCEFFYNSFQTPSNLKEMWQTLPRLGWLFALFAPRMPRFRSNSAHVGFLVKKLALGRFSEHFCLPLPLSFPHVLHTRLFIISAASP